MKTRKYNIVRRGLAIESEIMGAFDSLVKGEGRVVCIEGGISGGGFFPMSGKDISVEIADIPKAEFNPGDTVFIKGTGQNCLLIANHPHHPGYVIETTENELRIVSLDAITKERPAPTPLNIPWANIDEKWQWAAMDNNNRVWFYEQKPEVAQGKWHAQDDSDAIPLDGIFAIVTEDINWEQSLTERPAVKFGILKSKEDMVRDILNIPSPIAAYSIPVTFSIYDDINNPLPRSIRK